MTDQNEMPFSQAEDTVVPFGKYKGSTIGDIADEDILYLDWLVGEMEDDPPSVYDGQRFPVYRALRTYMENPAVQAEAESVRIEDEERRERFDFND